MGRLQARETRAAPSSGSQVLVGAGDDAAVFSPGEHPFAITTDTLVEGVHFRPAWIAAEDLGRRSVAVNVSDLAAMAAEPRFLVAAVSAPARTETAWLDALLDGVHDAAVQSGAQLVGGNLTRSDQVTVTITAIGTIPGRRLERTGARPGDVLVVTGTLGDAAAAVAAWEQGEDPEPALRERWRAPTARVQAGLELAERGAHAAIDLSDGLLGDLGHLCRASGVGAEIERERLPRSPEVARRDGDGEEFAARGGEDYELLFACPPELAPQLPAVSASAGVRLTEIGTCTSRTGEIRLLDRARSPLPLPEGFDHFAAARPTT